MSRFSQKWWSKGGSNAGVGLGFEIYVADTNRSVVTVEEDPAWTVSNDLIDVEFEDTNRAELTVVPPNELRSPDCRAI